MEKKSYTSPGLVRHGGAVEATRGLGSKFIEFINWRPVPSGSR